MTSIGDSDISWHIPVELAVAPEAAPERTVPQTEESTDDGGFQVFGEDGFTFLDFLDIINPLQHIPFIGTLYRHLTDDTLDPGSQVLGSTLFFGPVGTIASLANVWLEDTTGRDMGDHVMAFFGGEDSDLPQVAEAESKAVVDVGTAAVSARFAAPEAPEAIDPVTAWAMAEVAYRKSAAGKSPMGPDKGAPWNIDAIPHPERAAIAAPLNPQGKPQDTPETPAMPSLTTAEALSMLRNAKRGSAIYAAARNAGQPLESRDREKRETIDAPAGAIAPEGGWFSETMLTALGKYESGAILTGNQHPHAIDLAR